MDNRQNINEIEHVILHCNRCGSGYSIEKTDYEYVAWGLVGIIENEKMCCANPQIQFLTMAIGHQMLG